MRINKKLSGLFLASCAMGFSTIAGAASVALNVTNIAISPVGGTSATISILYTGDGTTLGVGGRINYDTTIFNVTAANGSATCTNFDATGRLTFNLGAANPLPSSTLCTFTVTHTGAAPVTSPYTFSNMTYTSGTGTETNGNIVVSNGPPTAPTIGYAPTTLNFPAGTAIPQNQDLNVTLTATGGANGGATSVVCSTSSPGFSIPTSASTCTNTTCATNPLVFRCVSSNAAQTGTATCAATPTNPAGAVVNTTITLNCPAANVAPSLAYLPTTGSTITSPAVGQGQNANMLIQVTPSAGSGTSVSTVSGCSFSPAAGFTAPAGTLTFTGSTTSAQNLAFSCVAPNAGSGNASSTLTCSQTIGAGAPTNVTWPVTCLEGAPVSAPGVTYTPPGGTTITFPAGASIGASVPGSTTVAVDINGGAIGGGAGPEQTSVSCTATSGFTVTGGSVGPIPAVASVGTDTTVNVSCTSAASAQAGTLTCAASQVVDGGAPTVTNTTFPLNCAAAQVNIASAPAEGAISVAGTPNTSVGSSINLTNTGSASTLACTATGSVTLGVVPGTVPAGGSAAIPFTCLTGGPGLANTGTIQCTTQDPGAEGTLDYTVTCLGVSDVPVPAINNFGKVLMVVLVIGLGLVGLGARRQ